MIKVKIKEGESPDRLVNRFNKLFQAARIQPLLNRKRYFGKKLSRAKQRTLAVMREFHRAKREKMKYY